MQLSGTMEEMKGWLAYAEQTECHAVYFMPGGHVFFLYSNKKYLYVKTTISASHNIRMKYVSARNVLRFIRRMTKEFDVAYLYIEPEEVRAQLNHRRVVVNSYMEWQTFTYLEKDSMYSDFASNLKLLTFSEKDSGYPTLRFNRKVAREFDATLREMKGMFEAKYVPYTYGFHRKRRGNNLLSIRKGELVLSRALMGGGVVDIPFKHGFHAISKTKGHTFFLSDEMLYVINVTRFVDGLDSIYLIETPDSFLVEIHKKLLYMKMSIPKELALS